MTPPAPERPPFAPLLLACCLVAACGGSAEPALVTDPGASEEAPGLSPVERMYADSDALLAREEHEASEVVVQNILIGVTNAQLPHLVRSQGEAEVLTAQVLALLEKGGDFDDLVRDHSSDQYPGIYTVLSEGPSEPNTWRFHRPELAQYFGDVAFRLQVGEIGVAPSDLNMPGRPGKSPFGFHIIQRLE